MLQHDGSLHNIAFMYRANVDASVLQRHRHSTDIARRTLKKTQMYIKDWLQIRTIVVNFQHSLMHCQQLGNW